MAAGLVATASVSAAPAAAAPEAPAQRATGTVSLQAMGTVRATGLSEIVDVSKNGRIVLGKLGGTYVVRDVVRNRTLRRLPSSSDYAYYAISDNGRYVAYSYSNAAAAGVCFSPWIRDRITNRARPAATLRNGTALRPAWGPPAGCPDEPAWRERATFSQPALSGNGRFVAFCANLDVRDRLDLYRKDLRTKRLLVWPGVCGEGRTAYEWPMPPQISETGRVILAPGSHIGGDEAVPVAWQPASLVVAGALRTGVGGGWPTLTDDGRVVFHVSPATCAGFGTCPGGPARYDVAGGGEIALAAGDPGPAPMSRRGRFAVVLADDPAGNRIWVLDRTYATTTELTATFAAAGVPIPQDRSRIVIPGDGSVSPALISGDGRVVFVIAYPEGRWYALQWQT